MAADGHALYNKHCLTCHQADGWGVPFKAAPLVDSKTVVGPPGELIAWRFEGTINAPLDFMSKYEEPMPGFRDLSDEDLAAILNYVRTAFAGAPADVTTGIVAAERQDGPTPQTPDASAIALKLSTKFMVIGFVALSCMNTPSLETLTGFPLPPPPPPVLSVWQVHASSAELILKMSLLSHPRIGKMISLLARSIP